MRRLPRHEDWQGSQADPSAPPSGMRKVRRLPGRAAWQGQRAHPAHPSLSHPRPLIAELRSARMGGSITAFVRESARMGHSITACVRKMARTGVSIYRSVRDGTAPPDQFPHSVRDGTAPPDQFPHSVRDGTAPPDQFPHICLSGHSCGNCVCLSQRGIRTFELSPLSTPLADLADDLADEGHPRSWASQGALKCNQRSGE
jgi:hypothetical protein